MTAVTDSLTWQLTIPAPAPWLNANQRMDLRRQTPLRRAWRDSGRLYAVRAKLPRLQRAHILAELCFADDRRRDVHNLYPTIKAVVDGLIDYGLLPDDDHRYLVGPDLRYGPKVAKRAGGVSGEARLTITDLSGVTL